MDSTHSQLSSLLVDLPIRCIGTPSIKDPLITHITLDRNEVTSGTLFIARTGWYLNTHEWVEEVIKKGASAVLVSQLDHIDPQLSSLCPIWYLPQEDPTLGIISSRFYRHPSQSLKVYGVTGTNGKTSTVHFLTELLTHAGERVACMGTVSYRFEQYEVVATNTTPDALVIQRFARDALDLGATALVLEVSSHALSLNRIAGLAFDCVGFTSLGRDHLDFHGSFEEYKNAKGILFSTVLDWSQTQGKDVIGVAHADQHGLDMLSRMPNQSHQVLCQVDLTSDSLENTDVSCAKESLNFAHKHLSSIQSSSIQSSSVQSLHLQVKPSLNLEGSSLKGTWTSTLETQTQLPLSQINLIGDYHPSNLAIALGMVIQTHPQCIQDIWQTLPTLKEVKGRLEKVALLESGTQKTVLIDYAHTPDALSRVLRTIRDLHKGQIITVFGCGGDRDRGKRPLMTQSALDISDDLWITSDNPRSEDPLQIIRDALAGYQGDDGPDSQIRINPNRRKAIQEAWHALEENGVLIIAGKGHENTQTAQHHIYSLDDQEAVRAAMYADLHSCDLLDVPFSQSLPLSLQWPAFKRLKTWINEAQMRPQGLAVFLVKWTEESEVQMSIPSNIQDLICVQSLDRLSEDPTLLTLTPRHKGLILGSPRDTQLYRFNQFLEDLPYPPLFNKSESVSTHWVSQTVVHLNSLKGGRPQTHFIPHIPTLSKKIIP